MRRLFLLLVISLLNAPLAGAQLVPADDPLPEESTTETTTPGTEETAPEVYESSPTLTEDTPTVEGTGAPDLSELPGEGEPPSSPMETIMQTGTDVLQPKDPVAALNVYLNGFHFMNGDMDHQMEAHHYCAKLNEHVTQCVIYDEDTDHARLIGLEYVVSRQVFELFSEEEKKLWHSHVYEVKSGQLMAPGVPEIMEEELMETLVDTYGKTWHTWDTAASPIPTGIPALMMGFTSDGQTDAKLIDDRDKRLELSTEEKKEARQGLPKPDIEDGADSWEDGEILQLKLEESKDQEKSDKEDKKKDHEAKKHEPTPRDR